MYRGSSCKYPRFPFLLSCTIHGQKTVPSPQRKRPDTKKEKEEGKEGKAAEVVVGLPRKKREGEGGGGNDKERRRLPLCHRGFIY